MYKIIQYVDTDLYEVIEDIANIKFLDFSLELPLRPVIYTRTIKLGEFKTLKEAQKFRNNLELSNGKK